ncbi:hypothetical protein NIES23_61420 (plasmid) [Trichormus variabilis NIES-23]|uniref:Uncharacterized protein n=1 Tax=Trichormus variabilis NIES-23 TaxID=1973479 RepID=A0A1Z4KWI6_ANAVA|nr:hypothetical protein NIES23_61420 [Trichormus variabilis NIES-23]
MQNQSNSVTQTIRLINRDSGFSDNQMAYRLALIMENHPFIAPTTRAVEPQERENLLSSLRQTLSLSQNTQSTEEYRQALKNKYYEEYLQKFGVAKPQNDSVLEQNKLRVENLITQRKKTFLQQIFERKQPQSSLNPKQNQNLERENNPISSVNDPIHNSLIPKIMNVLVTMGQTSSQGRIYEDISYRFQLLMREGMQFLQIKRKDRTPENALTAYKQDDATSHFVISENNLSSEEAQSLSNFHPSQNVPSQSENTIHPDHPDDEPELD